MAGPAGAERAIPVGGEARQAREVYREKRARAVTIADQNRLKAEILSDFLDVSNKAAVRKIQGTRAEGDMGASVRKNIALEVALLQEAIKDNFITTLPEFADPRVRTLANRLARQGVDEMNSPIIYTLLQKAIENPAYINPSSDPDPTQATAFDNDLQRLAFINRNSQENLAVALGVPPNVAEARFGDPAVEEYKQREDRKNEVVKRQQGEIDPGLASGFVEAGPERELYDSLADTESFLTHYQRMFDDELDAITGGAPVTATPEEIEDAGRNASENVIKNVQKWTNKIYEEVLSKEPDQGFDDLANLPNAFSSPNVIFEQLLRRKLDRLSNNRTTAELNRAGRPEIAHLFAPKRVETQEYDDVTGHTETSIRPAPEYDRVSNLSDFFITLEETSTAEKGALGLAFNIPFLNRGGGEKDKSYFEKLEGFAKALLKTHDIDMWKALPGWELVEGAKLALAESQINNYSKVGWQRDPTITDDMFFARRPKIEQDALNILRSYFGNRPGVVSEYEDWQLTRAIYMARIFETAIFMHSQQLESYAEPRLRAGKTTSIGGGEIPIYDPMSLAKTYPETNNASVRGLVFLPIDKDVGNFDHRKLADEGRKAWLLSHTLGQGAKNGTILDNRGIAGRPYAKMFIEMGNITRAGGQDTLGGWRVLNTYIEWLRTGSPGTPDLKPVVDKLNVTERNTDVLVNSWKRIENLGISVLQNFTDQLLFDKGLVEDYKKDKHIREAYEHLFKYLFKQYAGHDNPIGEHYFHNEQEMLRHFEHIFNATNVDVKERVEELKDAMGHIITSATYQRMPLKFMLMEKQLHTQNGITLRSELERFAYSRGWNLNVRQSGDINEFEQAVTDLIYVEQSLRMDVTRDMKKQLRGPHKNLYGDLHANRSNVNNSNGYILNAQYISDALEKRFPTQGANAVPGNDRRIAHAIEIHKALTEALLSKPRSNAAAYKKEKKEERIDFTRLQWWDEEIKRQIQFSFTSSEMATEFLNYSSIGKNGIARFAGSNAKTVEVVSKTWGSFQELFGKVSEEFAAKGEENMTPILEPIREMVTSIRNTLGDEQAIEVGTRALQYALYYYRPDDADRNPIIAAADKTVGKPISFSQDFTGKRRPALILDEDSRMKFIKDAETAEIVPVESEEKKYMYVKLRGINGFITKRIFGKDTIKKRDTANEHSGNALRDTSKSTWKDVIRWRGVPIFFLLALLLAVSSGKDEIKQLQIV